MAETPKLEEIAKGASPEAKKEEQKPKPVGTLESAVNETIHLGKTLFNFSLAGLLPATQATLVPYAARDTAILAGAQVAADATTDFKKGKKFTSTDVLKSSAVGTAISVPVYHIFDLINKIPTENVLGYVTKASAWGGIAYPVWIGMYQFTDYIIKNLTFKGVGNYIKEKYWAVLKKALKTIFPISLFNIFLVPPNLQVPVSAILSYGFALFGAPKREELKEEEKRDKTPFYMAASNAIGRGARNIFYGVPQAAYGIGSYIGEKLYSAMKPASYQPAKSAPAGTPALQPA